MVQDRSSSTERHRSGVWLGVSQEGSPHSPHIINLKGHDRFQTLNEVDPYREPIPTRKTLQTVNFAKFGGEGTSSVPRSDDNKATEECGTPIVDKKEMQETRTIIGGQLDQITTPRTSPKTRKNPRIRVPNLRISLVWWTKKRVFMTALLVVLFTVPIPMIGYMKQLSVVAQSVADDGTGGFLALQASTVAALHADIDQAEEGLSEALERFGSARDIIEREYHLLVSVAKLIPFVRQEVVSRQSLLDAGYELAQANTALIRGIKDMTSTGEHLTDRLMMLRQALDSASPHYHAAAQKLQLVDPQDIPAEHRSQFLEFRGMFSSFVDDLKDLSDVIDMNARIFGEDSFRRYLVIFQNEHELRPTGGFMGSFAIIDVQKGRLLDMEVPPGGTYDVQGQLTELIKPPLPLQLVNRRWEFQDANWFPDFAASAEKIQWFYEHSRNRTVDGVIAINASVLERLLRVLGPVVTEDGKYFSTSNVIEDLQYEVEIGYDREASAPKGIIGRLMGDIFRVLGDLDAAEIVALMSEMHEALERNEIQVQMNDDELTELVSQFGWGGQIRQTPQGEDYLHVSIANIGGGKADAVTKQRIMQNIVVDADGSIIKTVRLIRSHGGVAGQQFYGADNLAYVRFYVPEGSTLLSMTGAAFPDENAFNVPVREANRDVDLTQIVRDEYIDSRSGTTITSEFGKTVFGHWLMVRPGETSVLEVVYRVPFSLVDTTLTAVDRRIPMVLRGDGGTTHSVYRLTSDIQSGLTTEMDVTIRYPEGWIPVWGSDTNLDYGIGSVQGHEDVARDSFLSVVMKQ